MLRPGATQEAAMCCCQACSTMGPAALCTLQYVLKPNCDGVSCALASARPRMGSQVEPVARRQGPALTAAARLALGLWPTVTILLTENPASGMSVAGGCSVLRVFFWLCTAAVMLRGRHAQVQWHNGEHAEKRDWRVCTGNGHNLWFLQLLGAWIGSWAANSAVRTVCKLSFCSVSSSDCCSIESQCCIPWLQRVPARLRHNQMP